MQGAIDPARVGLKVDKEVLERTMKDETTEDVFVLSKKDGKIYRAKSGYAKLLIRQGKAHFVGTLSFLKAEGIDVMDMDKLRAYYEETKTYH